MRAFGGGTGERVGPGAAGKAGGLEHSGLSKFWKLPFGATEYWLDGMLPRYVPAKRGGCEGPVGVSAIDAWRW